MKAGLKRLDPQFIFATLGFVCCITWVFVAFPAAQTLPAGTAPLSVGEQLVLRFMVVGFLAGALFPLAARLMQTDAGKIAFFAGGCFLQIVGIVISNAEVDPSHQFPLLLTSYFLTGSGRAIPLILWGLLLCTWETESCERSFIVIFALVGALLVGSAFLADVAILVFTLMSPLLELVLYVLAIKNSAAETETDIPSRQISSDGTRPPLKEFNYLLFRTTLAIALVSFVWGIQANNIEILPVSTQILFGIGTLFSSLVIWLFTKHSSSVGFVAAAKWTLPIMAVSLLLSLFSEIEVLCMAAIILACAHGSLETIMRMTVILFAKRTKIEAVYVVGWGFAAIMLGAFLGPLVLVALQPLAMAEGLSLAVFALAILVIVSAFLFSASPEAETTGLLPASLDATQRAKLMREQYGLTARENEVLIHLLEGRSHPYIRDALYISKSTVDTHVRHIYAKTGVSSKQALIDLSMRGPSKA